MISAQTVIINFLYFDGKKLVSILVIKIGPGVLDGTGMQDLL